MTVPRRFARVYYDDLTRDHPDIWRDNDLLATWLRLLVSCEKAWPSLPELPRSVKPRIVARLVDLDMVSLFDEDQFMVRGFQSDRSLRQESARNAAAVRWQSARNATAMPYTEQNRKRTEQSNAREDIDPPWLTSWFAIGRHRLPTEGQQVVIDAYLRAFDVSGPERLSRLFLEHPTDPIGAAKDDLNTFREARRSEAKAAEEAAVKPRRVRGLSGPNAELARLLREQDGAA